MAGQYLLLAQQQDQVLWFQHASCKQADNPLPFSQCTYSVSVFLAWLKLLLTLYETGGGLLRQPSSIRCGFSRRGCLTACYHLQSGRSGLKLIGPFSRILDGLVTDPFVRHWLDLLCFLLSGKHYSFCETLYRLPPSPFSSTTQSAPVMLKAIHPRSRTA